MKVQMVALKGDKFKKHLDTIVKNLSTAKQVDIGWGPEDKYPDGTPIGFVAATQEFGAPKAKFPIPPRPFFRPMIAKESPHWGEDFGKMLALTDCDAATSLGLLGKSVSDQLRQSIHDTNSPALSPTTLMMRKMRSQDQNMVGSYTKVLEAQARVAAGEDYTTGVNQGVLEDSGKMMNEVKHHVS